MGKTLVTRNDAPVAEFWAAWMKAYDRADATQTRELTKRLLISRTHPEYASTLESYLWDFANYMTVQHLAENRENTGKKKLKTLEADKLVELEPTTMLGVCAWCGLLTDGQSGCVVYRRGGRRKLTLTYAYHCSSGTALRHSGNPVFEDKAAFSEWIARHKKAGNEILASGGPKIWGENNREMRGRTSRCLR